VWDVEDPTLSRQSSQRWQLGRQPYAPVCFIPRKIFYVKSLSQTQADNEAGRMKQTELKTHDRIGNLTRDLQACVSTKRTTVCRLMCSS
jgi:hypothetical protein